VTIVDLIGALPVHPTKTYDERALAQIRRLVLHHTAGPATQTPVQIAQFHVGGRDWPGIAYHYLVRDDGTVYKCWPARTVTYCVRGHNASSLCVALIGDFDLEPAPGPQWDAAVSLFRDLRAGYGPLPIEGHREIVATACPGRFVDMDRFRLEVLGA